MGCPQHDTSPSVPFTTMISVSHCAQRKRLPAAVDMLGRIPNGPAGSASRGGGEQPVVCAPMATGSSAGSSGPQRRSVQHDGLTIGVLDWGGDGPPLVLLHPNGFCAGVFEPVARRLRDEYRVLGIDVRGHGTSDSPATVDECSVVASAGDVVAMLDHLGLDEVVVLGESLGGGVAVLVDRQRPGLIRRLLICEAIAMPMGALPGPGEQNHMANRTRRRRAVWPDRATVLASFAGRPPLDVLDPEALAGYVRWGFRDRPDGQIELACPPEVEAWFFECGARPDGAPAAFEHLDSLGTPVTIACAEGSNLPHALFEAQATRAGVALTTLPGTHFFLQEDSARAAALVREYLAW
jgi:pimeloyl-ACP methyl ester carboxylesterase